MTDVWPAAWDATLTELSAGSTFALVDSTASAAAETIERLEQVIPEVIQVGQYLTACDAPGDVDRLFSSLTQPTLLLDLDILFAPQLQLNVTTLLRATASRVPLIAVWPGTISSSGRLTYSVPGRADHRSEIARGVLVLHPVAVHFHDEVPYRTERFS